MSHLYRLESMAMTSETNTRRTRKNTRIYLFEKLRWSRLLQFEHMEYVMWKTGKKISRVDAQREFCEHSLKFTNICLLCLHIYPLLELLGEISMSRINEFDSHDPYFELKNNLNLFEISISYQRNKK